MAFQSIDKKLKFRAIEILFDQSKLKYRSIEKNPQSSMVKKTNRSRSSSFVFFEVFCQILKLKNKNIKKRIQVKNPRHTKIPLPSFSSSPSPSKH